ncbi:hypothetical protein DN523_29225 [Burkholderia multivorans]|uniref:hypothetical protein n=1 Tax=Burkholderia cepacia complex TaxID=87882 RepID=UPI000DAD72A5|nr:MULTISPECIES: hypothetical protein [Burkholderia cepacia complex]MDS0859932.1 hypothetical protein [Burkholderia pseudomultivorans]RAA31155.1 hypothetical protein DN471_06285 [Burkholderia multivorans]RAA32567.1 hypothetical protein DN470_01245 [Burkholderia multivorans]RAA37264.1 hypothetical protein DN465_05970 [Burkholderia multivorans]RAA38183.1 hypothetical protein DN472_26715 [Burkholderia multivorans]
MMIKLTRDDAVNPAHVVFSKIEHRERDTRLVVELVTGSLVYVTHNLYDGVDVYKVHQALLDAKAD